MPIQTVQLDDPAQVDAAVMAAGEVFARGGVVVFPTETVYGVGAVATNAQAVAALRTVKDRPDTQPFTVHLSSADEARKYVDDTDVYLMRFLRKVIPGPVTVVVDVPQDVIAKKAEDNGFDKDTIDRLYHNGTIGLRCPDHDLGWRILGSINQPVVASSANRRGGPPPRDAVDAAKAMGDDVDLVIDGGHCRYAKASTIVQIKGAGRTMDLTVSRDGVYDERFIRKLLRWTVLLVCTGNTCRSPMAQVIAEDVLAKQLGVDLKSLDAAGIGVISAGIFAGGGQPASVEAVDVMRKQGLDLSRHRSRALTQELIHEADVIYCMTESHLHAVIGMSPSAAAKTHRLDPDHDVSDPIGGPPVVYEQCAAMIRHQLEQRIKEHHP